MENYKIVHKEGLEFLADIEDKTVDLVLTDPPYITSRDSGMDRWVAHVAEQNKPGATDIKTEAEWAKLKTEAEWNEWMDKGNIAEDHRADKLTTLKKNFLKYGSIYGEKYAVVTDHGEWDSDFTMDKLEEFVGDFYRVLKDHGTCIIFFDLWKITDLKNIMEKCGFQQIRLIEWVKTNPQPLNSKRNYLTNCREIALLGVKKSKPTFNSEYDKGIYSYPIASGKDRWHTTQKSLPLFEDLVNKHSNEGDLVLDCFLGSGTTAVACLKNQRKFTGCEVNEEYCKKSLDRVKKTLDKDEKLG